MNRRDFFKIVGATGAAAAAGGCQQATESILPLVVPNEQLVPGVAAWYATVCRECPAGCGVLARNREGRVVKLEGNPDHPVNQGALCGRGQAALQGLYHPDRFAGPGTPDGRGWRPGTWDAAIKLVVDRIRELRAAGQGRAIALVTQLEHGSVGALLDTWAQALGARPRVTLEPFGYEAIRAANRATFGRDAIPYYAFEDAEVVLSFGADFMETWLSTVGYTRAFARMHAFRDGRAGTFVHVEPRQSLTAANADEWVRNAPGTEGLVALAVLRIMVDEGRADRRFADAVAAVDVKKAAADSGVPVETLAHLAKVFGHARPGLAVGGGVAVSGSNATATQVAINLLNAAAGNVGKTVRFGPDSAYGRVTPYAEVAGLVLPDTHWLESWGDYSPREGVTGLLQPTMAPVRDARPMGDVLLAIGRAALGAEEGKGPLPWPGVEQYLKGAWEPVVKGQWGAALQQGGLWRDVAPVAVTAKAAAPAPAPAALEGDAAGFTLLPYPSLRFYDGRGASRAWLQETPDTMTQAVWDAWVEVPAAAAATLGIAQGDVVRVTSPHGAIELPAYVSPTLHPRAVAIPIGHRYAPYHVPRYTAAPPTPLNPLALLAAGAEAASGGPTFLGVRVTLARTGARRALAILQATHDQDEREIARHVDLRAAREQALRGKAAPEPHVSLYADQRYPGYRWGLAVDLDACVGCQACVVACQAENNVAVVGKAQAAYGRQLHWIRVERWAEGKSDHPAQTFLPMLCQHCEIAPCEPVCPVFAAYRTDEGLNGQVYNRCVGTRYCGNNCPYHVRRFNWFNSEFPAPLEVQLNPDVTVRQLGVMEKCTMCIQRIVAGKDHARDAKRPVKDGDILTACQQTCPTRAITFGNLKDDASAAAQAARSPRAYHVLDELGTRPSVTYLKKVVRGHGG